MCRRLLPFLVVFFIGLSALLRAEEPSLVPNGNFETDADADHWPDGWGRPKAGGSWVEENGNHFLRLTSSIPGEMVLMFQQIKIPPEVKAIEMTWRMRVTNLKKGKNSWFDARIMMDFKDADGLKLKGAPAPNTGNDTQGWVERNVTFLVPEGARTLDFMPTLFQVQSGTFDLDDVVLKATDPTAALAAEQAKSAALSEKQTKLLAANQAKAAGALERSGSLISNGDFEADKKGVGWPDDWGKPKIGGTWEVEEGNHFLRLNASAPGQTVLEHRVINLPPVKALDLSWRQRVSDLKVGKEPYFDARIMMEFLDASGEALKGSPSAPSTRKNTDGWVDRKVEFLVPDGTAALALMPALFQVLKGTFDLDDIVLRPIEPGQLVARKAAADLERKAAEVPAETPKRDKWPQELHVEGNRVLAKDGKPVLLQGVNVVSLEWSARGEQVMKSALVAIEEWKSNVIRLPVKEEYWFGKDANDQGAAYRELVDNVVNLVANRGAYVLLDLHRFKAPAQVHAEFWKDAATHFKNHPAVLFDLFNEPHGTSWETWRNGGFVAEKKKAGDEDHFTTSEEKAKAATGFQAIGMQALLDAVRGTGAHNIVLVGGLDYAYDLSGIGKGFALNDNGGNGIILSTHIYAGKKGWQEKVLALADKYPILVGELGANTKKFEFMSAESQEDAATWVPAVLGFVQKYKLHWTAYCLHPKSAPHLIDGWDYTPNLEWGAPVKRALAGEKFALDRLR